MTGPALRALAAAVPGRSLTLLTSSSGSEAGHLLPGVDAVLTYDAPWMKHTPRRPSPALDQTMIAALRDQRFDAAVVFTVFSQDPLPAALLCYLAGIPVRAAYCQTNPYQLLTTWLSDPDPTAGIRHEVRRQLDLVTTLGAPVHDERLAVTLPPGVEEEALAIAVAAGLDRSRPWLVVHPGATAPSRRYPAALFARVLTGLSRQGLQLVVTGSPGEIPLAHAIAHDAGVAVVFLTGALTLPRLGGLLRAAPLLLANNTGPVHLAAALGTPVVDLYALTNPQHTPWGVPSRVLNRDVPCRNCFRSECPEGHHRCLAALKPEAVVRAVLSLLRETSGQTFPSPPVAAVLPLGERR
ncbi:MAG: glycosyltransferase family 9 protein [Dehalococcoidia bacterium]|nr:glycosyltransferase family 9 protein [Dehalococcoidia bacterium]